MQSLKKIHAWAQMQDPLYMITIKKKLDDNNIQLLTSMR